MKFRALMTEVTRVAPVDSAVLIQGETGTGKEVVGLFANRPTTGKEVIESIPEEVVEALKAHDWPGNIRELQNCIERAMLFSPWSRSA